MKQERYENIIMYTTSWCSDCHRAKYLLDEHGIEYINIDVEQDEEGMDFVRRVNHGRRVVPTILFPEFYLARQARCGAADRRVSPPSIEQRYFRFNLERASSRGLIDFHIKPVTGTPFCHNVGWLVRVYLYLAPQSVNVNM